MLQRLTRRSIPFGIRSFCTQKTKQIEVTPATLRESRDKMLDAYPVTKYGNIEGYTDSCHYCKLPNGLIMAGRVDDGDRMLDYCVDKFLTPIGDFMNQKNCTSFDPGLPKTLHWEFADFYPYLNQWWITAGIRLNRFDFVNKAYNYVDKYWYNPKTNAALVQDPLNQNPDGYNEHCTFCSAHLGYTNLMIGNSAKAMLIGDTIRKVINLQPDMDKTGDNLKFYQRFDDNFNLLTSFPDNHRGVKNAGICNGNQPFQCWWSLGYPIAYLANLYIYTGEQKYLNSAEKLLDFVLRCNVNVRQNIVSHKVMWGASLVANITGKKEYWDLTRDIASHIMNVGQGYDGKVSNWQHEQGTEYGEAQIIDQTGEITYWFSVVARQMEKAEIKGTLK